MMPAPIEHWHQFVQSRELDSLKRLLTDDVVFEPPVVHTPQVGKANATKYLQAAMHVLGNDSFRYLNQWYGPSSAVMEFQSICEGIVINGVEMITWNADGQVTHFKVMVRPLKAVNKLHELMGRLLLAGG